MKNGLERAEYIGCDRGNGIGRMAEPGAVYRILRSGQATVFLERCRPDAQLLANRPDVQQAEQNYRYYFELTNVARAYFYPALTISGSAGYS